MCEFCHTHGEGKTWYLRAENYSEDLLSDLGRREFIGDFFETLPGRYPGMVRGVERLGRAPALVQKAVRRTLRRRQKADHFGQVAPIEEVERILEFATSVVRLACVCRKVTAGAEQRSCYGLTLGPGEPELIRILKGARTDYLIGPETKGLEYMGRAEALEEFRRHEKQGLCHTVWTFRAPFIGGLCNCDATDCLALRFQLGSGIATFFRAEFIAGVDPALCNGCRECLRLCPFGAMRYSSARRRVSIDPKRCYGCGICRSACARDAISLEARESVPEASRLWL